MQQTYSCPTCRQQVGFGAKFCGTCGKQLGWPAQQWVQTDPEEPSMHIIPLNPQTKLPVFYYLENALNIPAITSNGRLSWLIGTADLPKAIHDRIEYRYPRKQYGGVQSYVMCGVMLKPFDKKEAALIFEIWGFWEHFKELDDLYNTLFSLGGSTVGDANWNQIVQYLANDPVKVFINTLIVFLKKEINWKEYVDQALKRLF